MLRGSLEKRLAALEREVAELKASSTNGLPRKDWRCTIGMFTDDPEISPCTNRLSG